MKLEVHIDGRKRNVEIIREAGHLRYRLDGQRFEADALKVAEGVFSILVGGQAYEVRVDPLPAGLRVNVGGQEFAASVADPRQWRSRRGAELAAEGRQQIAAPMPGKVVRLLVKPGEKVEAGQGLLVVEAMKMQNEIKSPKTGAVERILVAEGQAVNAGENLIVIN